MSCRSLSRTDIRVIACDSCATQHLKDYLNTHGVDPDEVSLAQHTPLHHYCEREADCLGQVVSEALVQGWRVAMDAVRRMRNAVRLAVSLELGRSFA